MPDSEIRLPQFEIKLSGSPIPDALANDLASLEIDRAIFLPGVMTLEIHDPDLKWADDTRFTIGAPVTVSGSSGADPQSRTTMFEGEITSLEMNLDVDEGSTFFVRAYDKAHRLQRTRQVKSFLQQKDSDAINQVARAGGLTATVTATDDVREQILQDNLTDFDFICRLARRNGMVVLPEGEKLLIKRPGDFSTAPVALEYANDLLEFHPVLTAAAQVSKVTTRGWDPKKKQAVVGQAQDTGSAAMKTGWAKNGSKLSSSFGTATALITDLPFSMQSDGDALAKASLSDRWTRDIRAEGRGFGNPKIMPGTWLDLKKLGTRFSGKYFVTRARHVYKPDRYDTEFWTSGLEPETTADLVTGGAHHASAPFAGGGVVVGIVTNLKDDKEQLHRVKVKFPWLDDNVESWARVASPMAGAGHGFQFMPEINDEVVVAFDHGDRGHPYILGALWNGQDAPPLKQDKFIPAGKVVLRQIRTPRGHVIEFDDTEGSEKISITSSAKAQIVVDDKAKKVLVSGIGDKDSIEIDASGMGKITIKSGGDVTVEAGGKVTVNAKMDAEVNGMNVKVAAKGNLELSGAMVKVAAQGMLDLSANGITSVKGALVKIN